MAQCQNLSSLLSAAFFKEQISTLSDLTIYKTAAFNTFLVDYVDVLFDSYKLLEVL